MATSLPSWGSLSGCGRAFARPVERRVETRRQAKSLTPLASASRRRGQTLIEFTLLGIPVVFVLISIFEISRGMWIYDTLAHAVREGARFAIVHGNDCTVTPNSCFIQVRDIANRINWAGMGLIPTEMQNVRMRSLSRTILCPTLNDCMSAGGLGAIYFPAWPKGSPGYPDIGGEQGNPLEVSAEYPFRSAIAMFWPGAGRGMIFPTFVLRASSRERIQY